VAILEWKKRGGLCGPKEKSGGQHKRLSCMVIFRYNEGWFAMINPIKPNIVTSLQLAINPATYTSDCDSTSSGWHNLHHGNMNLT